MYAAQGQIREERGVGAVIDRLLQPSGQYDITAKPHGGAGQAPPATQRQREIYGSVRRGGIYAARATTPAMRYNG